MPRKKSPPRLYLKRDASRAAVWIILDGGRKISTGCLEHASREAEKRLAAYISEKHEAPGEHRASVALIADVLLHYLQNRVPQLARPKEEAYRVQMLGRFFGERTVAAINSKLCREYAAWRSENASTAGRRDLELLRAALNLYNADFSLSVLPVVTLPPPPPPREAWLTRDQAAALLRAAYRAPESKHLVRFILIGLYTGTRTAAILGLRWLRSPQEGSIDIEHGLLYRRGTKVKETKKRQPPARLHWRLIPHLKRWHTADEAEGLTHIITFRGHPVEKLRRSWDQACERAGFSDDIVKHSLRHTAATWLMQAGVSLWDAAAYLGMTVETLEAVYGHHHPDFQKNAAGSKQLRRRSSGG